MNRQLQVVSLQEVSTSNVYYNTPVLEVTISMNARLLLCSMFVHTSLLVCVRNRGYW